MEHTCFHPQPTHLTDYLEVYPELANSVRHDSINSAAQLN